MNHHIPKPEPPRMPSSLFDIYLALEKVMFLLDALEDQTADLVRDAMDPIWHRLSDEERATLDERFPGVRLTPSWPEASG